MAGPQAPIFPNSVTFEKVPQVNGRQLLEEAEKNMIEAMKLPIYDELVANSSYKRMKQYGCKGAAAAFLAHIYAWRAGVEGESEYWQKAEEYCSMIIEGKVGNYNMANNPEEVCTQVMKGDSQESIWELYGNATESTSSILSFMAPQYLSPIEFFKPSRDSLEIITTKPLYLKLDGIFGSFCSS